MFRLKMSKYLQTVRKILIFAVHIVLSCVRHYEYITSVCVCVLFIYNALFVTEPL